MSEAVNRQMGDRRRGYDPSSFIDDSLPVTDDLSPVAHDSLPMTDDSLPLTPYVLLLTLYVLLLMLAGCGRAEGGASTALEGWLVTRALVSERVAAPKQLAGRLTEWPVVALPEGEDAPALLATLRTELPDYVIAWPGVTWDGVRAQPWFQAHYRFLDTLAVPDDPLSPLRIYAYTPSPFDHGAWQPIAASFGGMGLELRALRVNRRRLIAGETLYLTLAWDGDFCALPDARRLVLRLLDATGNHLRAQAEYTFIDGLLPGLWRDGDSIISQHTLAVPDKLAYENYTLTLTVYQRNGAPVGAENLPLITFSYPPPVTRERPTPEIAGAWQLGDAVALIGYDAPERVAAGDTMRITLYWHARAGVSDDYKVFVHLLDANGQVASQDDSKPVGWGYPTMQWEAGEYIRDEHLLTLDKGMPRGDYTIFVGMYDPVTGIRLDITDAHGALLPDGRVMLRVVMVR